MKQLLILVFSSSLALIIYLAYLIIVNWNNLKGVESTLRNQSNTFAYIAVVAGVLGVGLALLAYAQTIKEPEFEISIVNEQGDYSETMGGELFVEKYSNGDIRYGFSVPTTWRFEIKNVGERTAKKVSIKLLFDNISFENDYIYDYKTTDHQRGIGGWQGLLYNKELSILPGEHITLPYLPFEGQAHMNNVLEFKEQKEDINNFKIKIYVYADDVVRYENEYKVKIRKPSYGEYDSDYNGNKRFQDILAKIDPEEMISTYEFYYSDKNALQIPDTVTIEDLEFAYFYCLKRIDSENSYNMRKFALSFGRAYYGRTTTDKQSIEMMIMNDIWAETKDFN